jgi:hypothetical protein
LVVKSTGPVTIGLRFPLESYLSKDGAKVFSLVAEIPFSPLDFDLGHLARGEWNALWDRFRLWYLPGEDGADSHPVCYLMIRKFDARDGVLVYGHVVVDIQGKDGTVAKTFTIGILSNDEIRARSMLNSTLDIPPSFHRRNEIRMVEQKWRKDAEAVVRFLANVHSVMAQQSPDPSGRVYTLKFEPPAGMMGELTRGLGAWW